jgi:hypothetical protein
MLAEVEASILFFGRDARTPTAGETSRNREDDDGTDAARMTVTATP